MVENKKYKPTLTSVGSNCIKNDGSASVQYTPGYKSLKWSNGATSETIANLATGKYYVSITDKMNVVWKDSVEVKAKSTPLTLSTVVVDATCDKNNASISLSTNATAKIYLWSNAATTAKIENLATGKYSATVTSSEDCISTISVDVLPKKVGAASVTANNTTCGKTDGNTEAILTGSTAKSFLWSNNATTAKLSNLSGGTYSVTITDENDCKITAQNKVIALENPIVSITKTDATCGLKNGTITATATGNVKFAWDNNQKTPVLEQLAVGTYTVTVTNNDACTATQFSTINALPVGILSLLGKNTTCNKNDASVEVTIKGGAAIKTYLWSNGATTPQISNLSGGTYTVSITDANACILTEKTTVKSLLSPIVNLGLDVSIKPSQSLVFDAGVGANYLWSTGANSQKITVTSAGTYSVTVTNSDGCSGSDVIVVKTFVGTEDTNLALQSIIVSPNPAQDNITVLPINIATDKAYIINALGQIVKEDNRHLNENENRVIDVSNLNQGVYYLVVLHNNTKKAVCFVKQ